jgi:hypothetical protein
MAAIVLAGLPLPPAQAGPMGFKGSTMSMGDFAPNWQETFANYALTPRDAVGAGALWMQSDDKTKVRKVADINYTRLLNRWNLPDAQANVWLQTGLGSVQGSDFSGTRTLVSPGIQIDYETTRLYLAANARLYRAKGINHDYASVRAGFSFYEVDYDEVQPWFILEARRMRGLSDKVEITPMLRLIHKRYFMEAGVNTGAGNAKQARFNFMYIF